MLISRVIVTIALIITVTCLAYGQAIHTPEKGSPERKAILDALRIPVERELKQPIVFAANHFNVTATWAFIGGQPLAASGGAPNYRGTPYQEAKDADMFDNNFFALLKKTAGKWRIVRYDIGCTDVCYADWWKRYKAPKAIFPYTE